MIAPNDPKILYSPANWIVTATSAQTINPGAYFRIYAATSSITLSFDVSNLYADLPILKWRIDQAGWQSATVASSMSISLPTNAWGKHMLEVYVSATSENTDRWSPMKAHVTLTGIDLGSGQLLPTVARPIKGVLFGDSITEGYKSIGKTSSCFDSDNLSAWSGRLADALGAEVGVVGFGGEGWLGPGVGGVPKFQTAYSQIVSGTPRDFTGLDFVIVNMGENGGADQSLVSPWIAEILTKLPAKCLLFMMRPFSGQAEGAIKGAVAAAANPRVIYIDTTGWWDSVDSSDGQHPYAYTSATITPKVAAAVRAGLMSVAVPPTVFRRAPDGTATPVYTATKAGA